MNKKLIGIVISCISTVFALAVTACNSSAGIAEPNNQGESLKIISSGNEEVTQPITELDKYLKGIDLEVADSFGISLDKYTKAEDKSLISKQNEIYYGSLLRVQGRIMNDLSRGDFKPGIYLSEDGKSGYVFQKKADGTNCSYEIVYDNEWKIIKTDKKPGKQVVPKSESTVKQTKLKPLSTEQVNGFANARGILLLDFKNVADTTIVLYESEHYMGTYGLSCDDTGRILEMGNNYSVNNSDITPVSIGIEGDFDKSLVHIIINDKDMLSKASVIKILFENENDITEYVDDKKGHIIMFPDSKSKASNIQVCSEDGSILFNQKITNFEY